MTLNFIKRQGRWIIGFVALVILILILTGDHGLIKVFRTHRRINTLKKEISQLDSRVDSMETVIEKLETDTAFIERLAREKLGMAGEDEKIFRFVEENE